MACQRRVTSQDAQCHRGKEPYAPICGLTGRLRCHRRRDRMRPYKPSHASRGAIEKETICDHEPPQAGHRTTEEETVCDHMRPHRPAARCSALYST